jgi:fatty acid-binding protein DegV
LLDVKPIISFEVGEVTAAGRVRTRRRALEEVLDHLREINDRVARLGVVHSDAAELDDFVAGVTEIHGTAPLIIRMGPIVGAHAGPGVLGVVYRLQ